MSNPLEFIINLLNIIYDFCDDKFLIGAVFTAKANLKDNND